MFRDDRSELLADSRQGRIDRLVLAVIDLDTCNLDHGADTPCVCVSHAWQSDGNEHESGCQELRDALLPFRGEHLSVGKATDRRNNEEAACDMGHDSCSYRRSGETE